MVRTTEGRVVEIIEADMVSGEVMIEIGWSRELKIVKVNDLVAEIGITLDDRCRVGEYQGVDCSLRPRPPQAADQRRGQQHVAQPAQGDDQNARPLRQLDAAHGGHGAAPPDPFAARCFSAMPPATPTPTT